MRRLPLKRISSVQITTSVLPIRNSNRCYSVDLSPVVLSSATDAGTNSPGYGGAKARPMASLTTRREVCRRLFGSAVLAAFPGGTVHAAPERPNGLTLGIGN